MPQPDETHEEALERLEARLDAAEAAQARKASGDAHRGLAQGYRFLSEVVGGVLMGAAVGWLADRFVTPAPLGLVIGLLGGAALSIFVAVRTAARMQKDALAKAGPQPGDHHGEDED